MNRRNSYLKDENLLTLFSLNNLIVPEIQREYVWGANPDVIKGFLKDLENESKPCCECHHVHSHKNINVGFLYSYKPLYVKHESERILDEYLIDGQQRITTLFLLLLYRATIENRLDDLINMLRLNEDSFEMAFNYKVRNLTQQFIIQLIEHAKEKGPNAFDFVRNLNLENTSDYNAPGWLLDDYTNDRTVRSMLGALRSIADIFGSRENFYFDYLLTNIHFWHFKTEATSQGEELYITMNSRGEQLSDNEMIRARTLPHDQLLEYGQKWEDWQTGFWRNRASNPNADKGFNNFLSCIDSYENFHNKSEVQSKEYIKRIERHIEALNYITGQKFAQAHNDLYGVYEKDGEETYRTWFKTCIDSIWERINSYDGSWEVTDPRGKGDDAEKIYKNQSVARNLSMLFWPWMYYFSTLESIDEVDDQYLIRLLHFYYIRYNCNKRSTTTITQIVDATIRNNFVLNSNFDDKDDEDNANAKGFSEEEVRISQVTNIPEIRTRLEFLIWRIQELKYFKDGKDVGGNTIFDYLKDSSIIDENNLEQSLNQFYRNIRSILKDDSKDVDNIEVKRALLLYGDKNNAFWIRQNPMSYYHYETSSWKRIVRNSLFLEFYKDFTKGKTEIRSFEEEIATFISDRRRDELNKMLPVLNPNSKKKVINRSDNTLSHREICVLYDAIVEGGLWDCKHKNIALYKDPNQPEQIFESQEAIYKRHGQFDGNGRIDLPENWKEILMTYEIEVSDYTQPTQLP